MANPVPLKEQPELLESIKSVGWLPICDPMIEELVYLKVPYWGFDGKKHEGELVVHQAVADDLTAIFTALTEAKFPIERIKTIDHYRNDDAKSMEDNNTSAFNCRAITNNPNKLSLHASGVAIDINPRLNPWVKENTVYPENAKDFADRTQMQPGMIDKDSIVYRLFKERGWDWGGDWVTLKDYQHFEKKRVLNNS